MVNQTSKNPIEGIGEEMIPDRGLPFNEIQDDSSNERAGKKVNQEENKKITAKGTKSNLSERDSFDSIEHSKRKSKTEFQNKETSETLSTKSTYKSEALEDSQESETSQADPEVFFDFTEEDRESLIEYLYNSSAKEATFWKHEKEDLEQLHKDVSIPSASSEKPSKEDKVHPTDQNIPEAMEDGGMSTHREDDMEEIAKLFSRESIKDSETKTQEKTLTLVSDRDIVNLWARANQAQQDVNKHITTLYIAQPLLDHIQMAQEQLIAGKDNYEQAKRHIDEVEYRLQLSLKLETWSRTIILPIFIYLGFWFISLATVLLMLAEQLFAPQFSYTTYLIGSMIWGGIGGTIGALLPLIKHFSEYQDFSKQHTWWYYASPFLGTAMGAIIYLFVSTGALSIVESKNISFPMIIYIFAGLSGYQHNIFTNLVKRMLKTLQINDEVNDYEAEQLRHKNSRLRYRRKA